MRKCLALKNRGRCWRMPLWKTTVPLDARHASSSSSGRSGTPRDGAGSSGTVSASGVRLPFLSTPARPREQTLAARWVHAPQPFEDFGSVPGARWHRKALQAAEPARKFKPRLRRPVGTASFPARGTEGRDRQRGFRRRFGGGKPDRPGEPDGSLRRPSAARPTDCFPTSKAANAPSSFPDEGCEAPRRSLGGAGTNRAANLT